VFGKQIKVQTTDGKTYYGEARIKSNAKKDLRLTDCGKISLTFSNLQELYSVNKLKFKQPMEKPIMERQE
ncbi:hypothetical protein DW070_06130, partial [Coprococcus catus]